MNSWNIADSLEREVRARDKNCVYCGVEMLQKVPRGSPRNIVATWEHIINDARITTRDNIALCCCGCNASKGQKALENWLKSAYCAKRGITAHTVAQIVKDALAAARKTPNQSVELTATRRASTFSRSLPAVAGAPLALGGGSSLLSR